MRIAIVAVISLLGSLMAFEAASACMNKGHSLSTSTQNAGAQITCPGEQLPCPQPYFKEYSYKCDQSANGKRCAWASAVTWEHTYWWCNQSTCVKQSDKDTNEVPSATQDCPE